MIMKQKSNFNENNFKSSTTNINTLSIKERILRNDSKYLLSNLKTQQNIVINSLNKLKEIDKKCLYNETKNDSHRNLTTQIPDLQISNNWTSEPSFCIELPTNNCHSKTVSFGDYLRTFDTKNEISLKKRISRSVSPHNSIKRSPKKSILKKSSNPIKKENLNDEENDVNMYFSSSSLSVSTNSLLTSQYFENDFDRKLKAKIDYNGKEFMVNERIDIDINDSSILDSIIEKRHEYLNHNYSANNSLSNLNNFDKHIKINKKSKIMLDKSQKLKKNLIRSNSAEHSKNIHSINFKNLNEKKSSKMGFNKTLGNYENLTKNNKQFLGLIETKSNENEIKLEKIEQFWNEICSFRNQYKDDCISSKRINFNGTISNILSETDLSFNINSNYNQMLDINKIDQDADVERNHKCIHSFTINERLFPVPVYKDKNGSSACPVCKNTRKEATFYSPQYCKISIPKSIVYEPFRLDVAKRSKSVNYEDTLCLVDHCVVGSENQSRTNSNIQSLPKSNNVDLKSASGISNSFSKLTIEEVKHIVTGKDPSGTDIYNKAHAMRYELENQHQKRLKELIPRLC